MISANNNKHPYTLDPMSKKPPYNNRQRSVLAQECAKIIAHEGIKDFAKAKRKAALRLGLPSRALMPSNIEIEQALMAYQRLFMATEQAQHLRLLRETAVAAMRFLSPFKPRLVGPVLQGTAGPHSDITLHVFANTPEDIMLFLMDHQIPFESSQRRLRFPNDLYQDLPVLAFAADEINIDMTVFWHQANRQAPRSPVDGRPMQRASLHNVEALLAQKS